MRRSFVPAALLAAGLLAAGSAAALMETVAEATWVAVGAAEQAAAGDAQGARADLEAYAAREALHAVGAAGDAMAYAVGEWAATGAYLGDVTAYGTSHGSAAANQALRTALALAANPTGPADDAQALAEATAQDVQDTAARTATMAQAVAANAALQGQQAVAFALRTVQDELGTVQPPPVPPLPLADDANQCFAATGGSAAAQLGVAGTWSGAWAACMGAQGDARALLGRLPPL